MSTYPLSPRRRRPLGQRVVSESLENRVLLTVSDVSVVEGPPGTTTDMVFTVSFRAGVGQTLFVDYTTADGTATAGSDYTAVSGTLGFFGTVLQNKQVRVPVLGDNQVELDEVF